MQGTVFTLRYEIRFSYVRWTVHRNSMSINVQQDETIHSLFYL